MANDRAEWTLDELMGELRARERAGRRSATGASRALEGGVAPTAAKATGVVARFRRLDEMPTSEIAKRAVDVQRGIYGVDDRKDTFQVTDSRARPLIDASLALVESADLHKTADGHWTLRTTSFKDDYDLCSSERFASQPLGCFCSGVLVAPDVVATAGHCVKSTADLDHIRFVFGFCMVDDKSARTTFPDDDVYRGTKVLGRKLTADATDWALVRLDRPVVGRKPVRFRSLGKVKNQEPMFVIGHPCGLPQKMAGGARIRNNQHTSYFVANLDTYGGNSGSPVFNATNYQLEGLLVRGQTDFVSNGSCNVSMVFPTSGRGGEDVTRTTEFTQTLPTSAAASKTAKRKKPAKGRKAVQGKAAVKKATKRKR